MIDLNLDKNATEQVQALAWLTDASRAILNKQAVERVLPMWQMTLGDLIAFTDGDFSRIMPKNNITLAQFVWLSQFPEWLEEFSRTVGALQVPTTSEQRQAANACLPVEWKEGMLVFARRYFGLHSFTEAEGVKVCDFILAKKDEYNGVVFERSMADQRKRAYKSARR